MAKQSNKRTNPNQPSHKTQPDRTKKNKANAVLAHNRRVERRRRNLANLLQITPDQLLGIRQFIRREEGEERAELQRRLNHAINEANNRFTRGAINNDTLYLLRIVFEGNNPERVA